MFLILKKRTPEVNFEKTTQLQQAPMVAEALWLQCPGEGKKLFSDSFNY